MWLDAADSNTMFTNLGATIPVTESGQSIKAWKDKSKNGYLFTALNTGPSSDGPTYTTSGLNGLSVTSWNGNQILQSSTSFPFYTDTFSGGSFFGVFNPFNTASQRFLMYYQNQSNALICGSSTEFGYSINNARTIGLHQGCGNATLTPAGSLLTLENTIISYILGTSGTTPANSLIYLNSTSYTSTKFGDGFYSAGFYPSLNNAQKLNIGGRYIQYASPAANPDCMHLGTIAELLWFNTPVSDIQRIQIEGYLAAKWGLQSKLPSVHTYKSAVPYNRSFRPIDIPGCTLWLDGADTSQMTFSSGTNISLWKDKSGNGNNATPQATQPIYVTGGGVDMPSTASVNYWLASPVTVPTQTHCLIAVHSPYTTTGYNSGNTSLFRFEYLRYIIFPYMNNNTPRGYVSDYDGIPIDAGNSTLIENSVANSKNLIIANIAQTSQQIYKNGTKQSSISVTLQSGTSLTLGIGFPGDFYSGILYEMIVFNTSLTMSQQLQIESYLGQKWGLASSLGAGHPGRLLPSFSSIFTPKSISQLAMWFDAADASTFVLASNVITQWNDKSGNGYNLTNNTGSPTNPTYANNQVNLISNGQYLLNNTNFGNPTSIAFSIFIVATVNSTNTLLSWGYNDANGLLPRWVDNVLYLGNGSAPSGVNWTTIASPITLGIKYIYSIIYTGYTGTNKLWINGTNRISVATGGPLYRAFFQLGARSTAGDYMAGNINEVLYYNNINIELPQQQQIEGYLAWKWGLQGNLPATHTYAKFAP